MLPAVTIPDHKSLASLTHRQRVIVRLVGECLQDQEIADKIKREPGTVRKHLQNIYRKLGTDRRTVLVRLAVRAGLVEV